MLGPGVRTTTRGHFNFRHMQRFIPDDEEHLYEDFRPRSRSATPPTATSSKNTTSGSSTSACDQETLAYLIRQKDNWAWDLWTEANLQSWQTDTQWLPRRDYYRLGDSLLDNRLTYFTHSGLDYANTHTADEVNNPNIFAFIPYDPISNTSGVLQAGRVYTKHEFDMPLQFSDIIRFVPYVQGQAVGWTNQINGAGVGRVWGAGGCRGRGDGVEGLSLGRERDVQRPRPEPQDQLRGRLPRRLSNVKLEPDRRPGRPRRQHLRVRPPLLRPDRTTPAAPARRSTTRGT